MKASLEAKIKLIVIISHPVKGNHTAWDPGIIFRQNKIRSTSPPRADRSTGVHRWGPTQQRESTLATADIPQVSDKY